MASSSSHPSENVEALARPIRKIKTRSMTSSNSNNPTVAFGTHAPPKATQSQSKGPLRRKNNNIKVLVSPTQLHRPNDHQSALNQNQPSNADRRPSTRQKTNPKSNSNKLASFTHSPVVVIESSNVSNPPKKIEPPKNDNYSIPSSVPQVIIQTHTLTRPEASPKPKVIVPTLSNSFIHPIVPKKPSELAPNNLAINARPGASKPSVNLPSPSHSTRRKSPSKTIERRHDKRLFEEIDNSSHDIFSFLDNRPRAKKFNKPATRQVFKHSQPSFRKSSNRTALEPDKNKHRLLASTKLLAGVQPQAKRLKRTSPGPATSSLEQQSVVTAAAAQLSSLNSQDSDLQKQSDSNPKSFPTSNLSVPSTSKLKEEDNVSPQGHSTSTPPELDKSVFIPTDQPAALAQDSRSLLTVRSSDVTLLLPSTEKTIGSLTPVKRPFESTSIQPLPPSISPLTHPADQLSSNSSTGETSLDAIDFLSPKKNQKSPGDPQIDSHSAKYPSKSNEASPAGRSSTHHQSSINPSTEPVATVAQPQDDQNNDAGETSQPAPEKDLPVTNDTGSSTRDSSGPQPLASEDAPLSNQPPSDQNATSTLTVLSVIPRDSGSGSLLNPLKDDPPLDFPIDSSEPTPQSSKLLGIGEGHNVTPIPMQGTNLESEAFARPTTPKIYPRLIPKRTSPIKEPTLPTSIPIKKPSPPNPSTLSLTLETVMNQSSSNSSSIEQASRRPSMLPRRALKPSMGTNQPLTFNVIPCLDAIIENSPEKRPVRDALSAASLNLSRGVGAPPKVIFTGGIKSKMEGIFARPPTIPNQAMPSSCNSSKNPNFLEFSKHKPKQAELPIKEDQFKAKEEQVNIEANVQVEGEDVSADVSSTTISTQSSTSLDTSLTSNGEGSAQPQTRFLGNISMDTQDRLNKLQNMLTKMGRSVNHSGQPNRSPASRGAKYFEYEVSLKDGSEMEEEVDDKATTAISHRARRRSSSVPLNYSDNTLSRSISRQSVSKTNPTRNQSKGVPTQRRVSNILPSARIDDIIQPTTSSSSSSFNSVRTLSKSTNSISNTCLPCHTGDGFNPASTNSGKIEKYQKTTPGPLKDVIAFVDVRTAEGDDAGKVFVEMLKGLGAKVVGRTTTSLTHIIFKAGKQSTIDRYKAHPKPKPKLVGIGWVVRCREILGKADETKFEIELNSSQLFINKFDPSCSLNNNLTHHHRDLSNNQSTHHNHYQYGSSNGNNTSSGTVDINSNNLINKPSHNRRKSMEPKALSFLQSGLQLHHPPSTIPTHSSSSSSRHPLSRSCFATTNSDSLSNSINSTTSTITSTNPSAMTTSMLYNNDNLIDRNKVLAESIDKARRKSLQFLPKIGSPLANRVFAPHQSEEDGSMGQPSR